MSPLVQACDVSKVFWARGREITALSGVNLEISVGETVGVVGSSGSGKSTLGRLICGFERPDRGTLLVGGAPPSAFGPVERRRELGRTVQMVFQDPGLSLDPLQSIQSVLEDVYAAHRLGPRGRKDAFVMEWLRRVGLDPMLRCRRTATLSGGEKQRLAIARAASVGPSLLILDEITASLDLLVRSQILRLLFELKRERRLSYLWISHDWELIRMVADRVISLREGRVTESAVII